MNQNQSNMENQNGVTNNLFSEMLKQAAERLQNGAPSGPSGPSNQMPDLQQMGGFNNFNNLQANIEQAQNLVNPESIFKNHQNQMPVMPDLSHPALSNNFGQNISGMAGPASKKTFS